MDYSAELHFQTSHGNMDKAKHSPRTINWGKRFIIKEDGAGVVPSRTYKWPQMISIWGFLIKRTKNCLENGAISSQYKEVSKRFSSIVRGKLYVGRGRWGGWIIRTGGIISKSGWYGENCFGVTIIQTGWEGRRWWRGGTKGEVIADYGSGWSSCYFSLYCGVTVRSSNCWDKLGLWGAWPYKRNWLAKIGWNGLAGQRDQTRRGEGGAGGLEVARNILRVSSLALEVRWVKVSGGCHQFHQ